MSRARPMPPDERRRALIDATLPLLLQHGTSVSTRQIAEAAGVAEGTIFRVFASKDDLLHATLTDALAHDTLPEHIARIPRDAGLASTVTHLAAALLDRIHDVRTLVTLLHRTPRPATDSPDTPPPAEASPRCERPDPRAIHQRLVTLVTEALTPHADALRATPEAAAAGLVVTCLGVGYSHDDLFTPESVTDLLLHGITKDA